MIHKYLEVHIFKSICCLYIFSGNINFLTADGSKFSHPLHHLGKTAKDLPVLAIDSFRHMYVFPHNVDKDLE